ARPRALVAEGAEELHLVDLDRAETGASKNLDFLAELARESGVRCRLAGGISRIDDAREAIDRGFAGVLFSSAVFGDDELLQSIASLGGAGIVEVEARAGFLAPRGGDADLVALETVLAEMGPVDALWVCGDTVGYGPDPSDVLALLVERKATIVAGNHDRAVAAGEDLDFFNPPAAVAAKMHQAWLTSAERELLAGLPRTLETGGVTLCHGSLRDPLWEYVTNPRSAAASLALARTAHCCAGHTHV